jgi:hypothetical protein
MKTEINNSQKLLTKQKDMPIQNVLLGEVLSKLAKKELQVNLFVGYRDSLNGYGWHVRYYVEVIKCIEYCPKCRAKHNVNYKDDQYPLHHQHSHYQEYKTIFTKDFMSESKMCMELLNFT